MSKATATDLPGFKTSLKRSVDRPACKRATGTPCTAARAVANSKPESSPVLRGQKRKQKEDLPDPPAGKRMSAGQDLVNALTGIIARLDKIDQGLKENASKLDVNKMQTTLANIMNQMNSNSGKIEWLMEKMLANSTLSSK